MFKTVQLVTGVCNDDCKRCVWSADLSPLFRYNQQWYRKVGVISEATLIMQGALNHPQ